MAKRPEVIKQEPERAGKASAKLAANARHHAKLKLGGVRKVTIRLSPDAQHTISAWKERLGSHEAVIEHALSRMGEPD